jgi:hypothetical protein
MTRTDASTRMSEEPKRATRRRLRRATAVAVTRALAVAVALVTAPTLAQTNTAQTNPADTIEADPVVDAVAGARSEPSPGADGAGSAQLDATTADGAGHADVQASNAPPPSTDAAPSSNAFGRLADGSLDPCATDLRSRPSGPLSVSPLDGQLGMPTRACPRDELSLGGEALLVADITRFYGNIRASGRVRFSRVLDEDIELFASWEPARYQLVLSSIDASYVGLGYLSAGTAWRFHRAGGRAFALTGRAVLPTTSGLDQASLPLALDVGATAEWQADANFRFHAWATLLASIGVGVGPAEPRAGVRLGGGVDWRPYEWLSFVLELQAGFGYLAALDLVAAQAGARFALGTELGLEFAASMPLAGVRAFDSGALPLAATLALSWRMR